jgi:hypothetical protein
VNVVGSRVVIVFGLAASEIPKEAVGALADAGAMPHTSAPRASAQIAIMLAIDRRTCLDGALLRWLC